MGAEVETGTKCVGGPLAGLVVFLTHGSSRTVVRGVGRMMVNEAGPEGFTVRILGADGKVRGLGVLVGERHVVTCAHVINAVLGREQRAQPQPGPETRVFVDFPLLDDSRPVRATVVAWLPPSDSRGRGDDVAGLVIGGSLPSGAVAARLAVEPARAGHEVRVFGYPVAPARPDGGWVSATVRGAMGNGRMQIDSSQDSALKVQPGFSGSALYDDGSGRVVGLLAAAPIGVSPERDGYAISADRLRLAWPEILAGRWQRTRRDRSAIVRSELTILQVSDLRFGSTAAGMPSVGDPPASGPAVRKPTTAEQAGDPLFGRLHRDLAALAEEHDIRPDILVVAGGLASQGLPSEFRQAMAVIGALAEAVDIPRSHVAIVPGVGDINRRASAAYFADAEAEEREPVFPFWPKWKHFAAAFSDFYADIGTVTFTPDEPWTLFEMSSLNVVVAGINTTMAESHRAEDHYAMTGEHQLGWFEGRLARYQQDGWLRLAALHHVPVRDVKSLGNTRVPTDQGLRDADDLDQILGRSGLISLALNGTSRHVGINRLSSGLITVSPGGAATGHYQLITVRRDSLTLRARQYEAAQHRWIGDTRVSATGSDWREDISWTATSADAALPPPGETSLDARSAVGAYDGDDAEGTLSRHSRPQFVNEFLDRVAEATRVRFPEAAVTQRSAENYLRITVRRSGGAVEQWPIGVIDGPATGKALDVFASGVHARFASADPGLFSELVYTAPPASADLLTRAQRCGIRLQSLLEYQGLLDLSQLAQAQRERLAADRLYPPRLYVEQRYRIISGGHAADVHDDLADRAVEWMGTEGARLVVVLGDFGRGKTSFLRQLTRVLHSAERPGVTPILVELRHLEKAPTLDELLMQHLVRQGVKGDFSTAKLRYMITSGRVALLFDGFDELELRVGYDHAAEYLQALLDSANGQAKLILTSRTQHFRSTEQVRTVLGKRVEDRAGSLVVVLEEFSNVQILEFLTKLYPDDPSRAQIRFELISGIANLLDLAHNPRMLTFVADLDEERLRTAARNEAGEITAASLYKEIIDFWLTREEERHTHEQGLRPITKEERLSACTALALRLWTSRLPQLALTDLSAEVTSTLRDIADRGYTDEQVVHSIASGSLLVRDEDGTFTFIHQSIMEWLVASAAARSLGHRAGEQILATQQMSQLMAEFFTDLAGIEKALLWTTQTLSNRVASEIAKQNALAIANRVGMKPGTQLAGMDLRGQDLFRLDLRGADLSGANLSGMTLHGTDFLGANLSDANLTGVRMVEGSLRGANLAGSRWNRAIILGTVGLPDPATAPEIGVAAVADRDLVEVILPAPGTVTSVAFSPVSTLLAIGRGTHVQLVDAETGKTIRLLTGNTSQVNDVAFSPDGSLIAAASNDQTVRIWEVATGIHRTTLRGHGDQVGAVAFSPDGSLIATASDDHTARTWDSATGTHRTTFNGHSEWVRSVAFSPDGSLIATASRDWTARTWDTATGTQRVTFNGHREWVRRVAFSPDGSLIVTASRDSTARIWDTVTGTRRTTLSEHFEGLNSVAFSPDGSLIATTAQDNTARIWDTFTGTSICTLRGHTDWVRDVAFSADGTLVATASRDGTVCLWDAATWTRRSTLGIAGRSPVRDVAFSPDGSLIATASGDLDARIWDAAKRRSRATRTLTGHAGATTAVAFSPNSSFIATASDDGTARIWHTGTGGAPAILGGHTGEVTAVAFSPDGSFIATASSDTTVRIWDAMNGSHRGTITAHIIKVNAVAFSPDGSFIATASDDSTARIWSLAGHRPIATLFRWTPRLHSIISHSTVTHNLSTVNAVAFSPDSSFIATASDDGTARICEIASGTQLRKLIGHTGGVNAVAFSPDGSFIATASDDGTARIWHTSTGAAPAILGGHTGGVNAVAFSPDGSLIATASSDTTVRIWDATTGTLLGTLIALPGGGNAMLLVDGGYRVDDPGDDIWWAIKLCRFNPGELDPYVQGMRRIADGEWIFPRPRPAEERRGLSKASSPCCDRRAAVSEAGELRD
ncbi:MAG: trypsin-like peptidase domain-containing protein [Trebonia sp.]